MKDDSVGFIVTTGKIIKVDSRPYYFERSSEAPGCVEVVCRRGPGDQVSRMTLPSNPKEMATFIEAYRAAAEADVGYRESGFLTVTVPATNKST